jgi:hypothetical protein
MCLKTMIQTRTKAILNLPGDVPLCTIKQVPIFSKETSFPFLFQFLFVTVRFIAIMSRAERGEYRRLSESKGKPFLRKPKEGVSSERTSRSNRPLLLHFFAEEDWFESRFSEQVVRNFACLSSFLLGKWRNRNGTTITSNL